MDRLGYDITIFHLVWLPFGVDCFNEFLVAYKAHRAGISHRLEVLFNGVKDPSEIQPYLALAREMSLEINRWHIFKTGQDIDIYRQAASTVTEGKICFLNSYSRILADNWLLKLNNAFEKGNVGIVGATASFASYKNSMWQTWKRTKNISIKLNLLKYLLKFEWKFGSNFSDFPSPHIRTTGFLIEAQLFNKLQAPILHCKEQAYIFENGKNSMTAQVLQMGLRCLLVDKTGNIYDVQDWERSEVFWNGTQQNLLIADNQTEKYQKADAEDKKFYNLMAWGK